MAGGGRPWLVLLFLFLAVPAGAQEGETAPRAGDQIRLWAPFAGFTGERARLIEARDRVLVVRRDGARREVRIEDVERMEARRSVGHHLGTGALIGGITGATATTAFLVLFCDDPDSACEADEVFRAVGLIGVPPLAVGSLIGLVLPRRAWLDVRLGVRREAFGRPGGPAVGLEVSVPIPAR